MTNAFRHLPISRRGVGRWSMLPSLALCLLCALACSDNGSEEVPEPLGPTALPENLIVCCEGIWQSDNGQLCFFDAEEGTLTGQWFRKINGMKLGDTPNDILQVNDTLIAIAVNWSNIIQYIHPDGTACGATENVPNNRRMCTDGRHLFVTSYAHHCGSQTFEKGYVAKIDLQTKAVVAACEVGWEPEGIRLYDGKLYVANSGGYSFSEVHHYETTVHVVDAETMRALKTIDTKCINLAGDMSQAGRYLCINSCGDYYGTKPRTVILDCETDLFTTFDFPSTVNASDGRLFFTVGSEFSYLTGEYSFQIHTIDPAKNLISDGILCPEISDRLKELEAPYALYISPFSSNIYFTDACSHASAGKLYGYSADGRQLFPPQKVYMNPGKILAIKTEKKR